MEKAYKYRIYLNKKQKEIIAETFGCCRFVYNKYLAKRIEMYEQNKETFSYVQCANDMKQLKSELEWLKEVDSTALQSSLKDLDCAYQKFFKEHAGYPISNQRKLDNHTKVNLRMGILDILVNILSYLNSGWSKRKTS